MTHFDGTYPYPPLILLLPLFLSAGSTANPDAKRLYDDLLSNYNKLVRPVVNVTDALTVRIKLKLSQLIDVNLKNQIMTTNLWVEQSWYDYKLKWEPKEYGGVEMLHVPSDHIWRPDIVLYNNADGNFEVTLATKATLNYTGRVEWRPPAIYKSSCEIDVEYFPFDEQTCVMKFGSWTYDGFQVDLRHIDELNGTNVVEVGVDLSEFYTSVEWDILEVPAVRFYCLQAAAAAPKMLQHNSQHVKEDWKYVAMVLDRLFLWIFTIAVVVGTAGIILQAPTLYDTRMPIDIKLSEIASTTAKPNVARPVL
ncbi:GD16120 [Drosophila simulans]|uniref:GD16120 n=1 Tax=Drosophila simulans TaxID=7240 RepID=B4R6H7_DROSI|nr:GD16120 [Drosophila simulans]